ncbi:MAG: hypothetical protein AAFY82_03970 [Pseudomonadota bacterium]
MTFKEKSAWIMSVALVLAGGFYAWSVVVLWQVAGVVPPPNVLGLAIAVIIIIAFAIFGHAVAALGNPMDADAPEDERDRLVVWRAGNLGGLVLGALSMSGLFHFAFLGNGNLLFHSLIAALTLSQLAEYVLTIWYYRRGV